MIARSLALSAALLLVSGCTFLGITEQKTVKQLQVSSVVAKDDDGHELNVLTFPTQLRGAYAFRNPVNLGNSDTPNWQTHFVVCAEPFADIGMSSTLETSLELVNNLSASRNYAAGYNRSAERSGTIKRSVEKSTVNDDGTVTTTIVNEYESSNTQSGTASGNRSQDASMTSDQSAAAGLDASSTVVELGGRTQYVVLARELLYRTCEMAANGFLNAGHVRDQQEDIINALTNMLSAEEKKAEAKKATAEAARTAQAVRLAEALNIPDADALDIDGEATTQLRRELTQQLLECDSKFKEITDQSKRQQSIEECQSALSRLIQRLGK